MLPEAQTPKLLQIQHQWPNIARDIALLSQPQVGTVYRPEQIAAVYDLTLEDFCVLIGLPSFTVLVSAEVQRLKELGPFAGHRVRAEAIATDIQEQLYTKAKAGQLEDKVLLKFLDSLQRSAGLGVDSRRDDKNDTTNVGVSVTFNIPQLENPKLRHLTSNEVNVIDV